LKVEIINRLGQADVLLLIAEGDDLEGFQNVLRKMGDALETPLFLSHSCFDTEGAGELKGASSRASARQVGLKVWLDKARWPSHR